MIEIKKIPAEQTFQLRHQVLRPMHTAEEMAFPQDQDPTAVHFGAFKEGKLVGIATISQEPKANIKDSVTWRLRGMAIAPECQGQGIGAKMVSECLSHVKDNKGALLWCNARKTAQQFYEKLGFKTTSEEFQIAPVGPHFVMEVSLH